VVVAAVVVVVTAEVGGVVEVGIDPVVVFAPSRPVQATTETNIAMANRVRRLISGAYPRV
jgi:hypothetical protein